MTVNAPTVSTTADNATICEGEDYTWSVNGVTYSNLAAGVYTYADTVVSGCSMAITTLTLEVTAIETVILEPVAACESYEWYGVTYTESGEYTYTNNCKTEVLKLTINNTVYEDVTVTECHGYTWNGENYTESGDYTFNTTSVVTGCDSIVTLHLTITAGTPETDHELAQAEAVAKYGNRLIMLNLNKFIADYGWTPAADDVNWYQVNGDVDTSWDVVDDLWIGSGYYIESQEGFAGQVYAVINATVEDECKDIHRTKILALNAAGVAPKLMPTIARPSETLHLTNLNPSNVTEVRVYSASGELMATYNAEEASEFVFKAATLPGYYMVEVQNNGEQTTLRYIVK